MQINLNLKQKAEYFLKRPNLKAVLIITFFTFLSRGLGLLRNVLVLNRMDKIASDLLVAADKIPSNIAQLLITGAIISSVLPVASRLETDTENDKTVSKYLNLMMLGLLTIILVINVIVLIFTPQILSLPFVTSSKVLSEFKEAGILEDYFLVTRILLIGPLLFAAQAILNVFLFLKKRFVIYSLAGVIYNLGYIFGILATPRNGYLGTAVGAIVGIFLSAVIYLIEAKRFGYLGFGVLLENGKQVWTSVRDNFQEFKNDIKGTWKVFLPRIFILDGVVTANLLITPIAQMRGQITAVDIALSVQGAFFIIISSLSTVVFPDLAKLMVNQNNFWKSLFKYTKNTVFLSILVTFLTLLGAPVIMYIFTLFGKGQENEGYIVMVAQIASLGIVFRAFREILAKYFYVKERLWEPATLSIAGVLFQVLSVIVLYRLGLDSGINVALSLIINNFVWSLLAFLLVWKDWKIHKADGVSV